MELNVNKKINIQTANNSQNILPVPLHKPPTPSVESPNYYGKSPYPMAHQVSSRKNDQSQFCNTLGPSPRNQLLNADEVFLTSSGSFITPILKIDNKKINNGKIGNITLKLAEMYSKLCMHG